MDNTYHHQAPPEKQQPPGYSGGYVKTPYTANRSPSSNAAPEPTQWTPSPGPMQSDHAGSQWTPSPAPGFYGHQAYGFNFATPPPGGGGFGGPRFAPPYGFDPSVPPPPFGGPPPGHMAALAPVNTYSSTGTFPSQFRAGPQPPHLDFQSVPDSGPIRNQEYDDFCERGALLGGPLLPPPGQEHQRRPGTTQPVDEAAIQRRQDTQWLRRFLQSRVKTPKTSQTLQQRPHYSCVPALREALYGAARLVSALEDSCETLKHNVENDCVWTDSYLTALNMKRELQDKLKILGDGECVNEIKAKLTSLSKRRARRLRARKVLQMEEKQRQEDMSEKEAAIDKWRMKKIHEVEEKKREQELKLAADSVLSEVRRKQADVKRMQDILRSLEKLRKLRKEAASRKGIVTEQECDEVFSSRLEELRSVMKRRTAVYSVEEKALMVMLEGEQEEERRREQERRVKKERERQLQRKHRVDSMLFGDELPVNSVLLPFREYYTQAEHSLHALIQIRREWDVFVVAADHPDGTPVPQSWVLPDPPSDQDWASALHTADTDGH